MISPIREIKADFDAEGNVQPNRSCSDLADAPDPASVRRAGAAPAAGWPQNPILRHRHSSTPAGFDFWPRKVRRFDRRSPRRRRYDLRPAGDRCSAGPGSAGSPNLAGPLYDKDAVIPIQISAAAEHYNRLARMVDAGEKVTMTVDLTVEYQDTDLNGYNTIAEIPGTDQKTKSSCSAATSIRGMAARVRPTTLPAVR